MTFTEAMRSNPPRLVVLFRRADNGEEQFQWGLVKSMPIHTLVGSIVRVQSDLMFKAIEPCDKSAFVLTWDEETHKVGTFVHPDIPVISLLGMLETVKALVIAGREAQRMTSQGNIVLGPDGTPMR